jgi:choline monooxygenase
MKRCDIEARLQAAETPTGAAYCDPALFAEEQERIFSRSWLAVPSPPQGPESIAPFTLLPGALDEPLVYTRDADGVLRCLSNVCTHRGMLVACESGSAKRLRCGYHGRRFGLDGSLEAAPGFEGAEDFPRSADDLPSVTLGTWGPIHFVSMAETASLTDWFQPLFPWLDFLDVDALIPDPEATRRYTVSANWKLYVDNYLEGFHIPTVHKSLAAALDVGAYRSECLVGGSLQIGMASPGGPTLPFGPHHPLAGQEVAALYFHLFPNTLINVYPWGLSINHVNPTGLDSTEVIFERYVGNPALLDQGAGSGLHRVELEDEAVVEATQRGVRSRLYTRGRYAPNHEAAVHHFHQWWAAQI